MKSESCRKCGTFLVPSREYNHKCMICNKPTRQSCPECKTFGEIQFHPHLFENPFTKKKLVEALVCN